MSEFISVHVGSMSGLWGPQTALDLYLQEEGITTLLFSGVNADQVSKSIKLMRML
jgi:nicotinamidase-related amidase